MFNFSKFLQPISLSQTIVRNTARYGFKNNKNCVYKKRDRVLIEGTISYYPRFVIIK